MKFSLVLDLLFALVLLPAMIFLFPVGEWALWHPRYVLIYIFWLYAVWFLCRLVLGTLMLHGWRGVVTVIGLLLVIGAITFTMALTPVDIPDDPTRTAAMRPHVRAMWVLLLAVIANGLPMGVLAAQLHGKTEENDETTIRRKAEAALEARRAEAETGEEIQVKSGYQTIHLPLSAIQYIEGRNNYACFHLDNRADVVTQMTLKSILERLPEGTFVRIHRSYIVPVWRIEKRSSTSLQLMGIPEPFPVGRAYKDNLDIRHNG